MNEQILFGVTVVPAIVGLTQVVKELGVPGNVAPAIAVLFGVLAGLAQLEAGQWVWVQAVVLGISLGLSACGLYSGVKAVWPGGLASSGSPDPGTLPVTAIPPHPEAPAPNGGSGTGSSAA